MKSEYQTLKQQLEKKIKDLEDQLKRERENMQGDAANLKA